MLTRLKNIALALFITLCCMMNNANAQTDIMTLKEANCMTTALYHEARGESDRGMFAVASVILNRAAHDNFPDNVCGVINQRGQFSFDKSAKMIEQKSVMRVRAIVTAIQEGFVPVMPYTYFHRFDVNGQCTMKKYKVRIGNHLFC